MQAEMKKTLALSDILDEFEINRLGKLMFRTVVNSFSSKNGRTDRRTDIASDDIRYFFQERKKNAKNLLSPLSQFYCAHQIIGLWI